MGLEKRAGEIVDDPQKLKNEIFVFLLAEVIINLFFLRHLENHETGPFPRLFPLRVSLADLPFDREAGRS